LYQALDTKVVDRILVIPAFWNPWKDKPADVFDPNSHDGMSLDEEHRMRCNLCKAMFKDLIEDHKVYVSDIEYEIWRKYHKYAEDCIYSYETLAEITRRPCEYLRYWDGVGDRETGKIKEKIKFFLVTTAETLVTIPNWKDGQWILSSFPILAMKSENLEALAEKYVDEHDDLFIKTNGLHSFKDVPTAEMIDIPIHSTEIRDRFLKFKSIRPYVNRDAWDIMNENRTKLTKLYESIAKHKK
jgi:nicotinic acid mononucleotide adenylyltransferase